MLACPATILESALFVRIGRRLEIQVGAVYATFVRRSVHFSCRCLIFFIAWIIFMGKPFRTIIAPLNPAHQVSARCTFTEVPWSDRRDQRLKLKPSSSSVFEVSNIMKSLRVLYLLALTVFYLPAQSVSNPGSPGVPIVTATPAICVPNVSPALVIVSTDGTSGALYQCSAVNTWTAFGSSAVNISTSCLVNGGPITGTGALSASMALDSQTGAGAFAIPTGDCGKLIYRNNAAAVSDTLAQAGSGGNFPSGWFTWYQCVGAGGCTITPTTSTINGAASLGLAAGVGVIIQSDGTNYRTTGTTTAPTEPMAKP